MVPIESINANADTDVDIQDSCNCWSSCCGSKKTKQAEKDKILNEKIRKVVMEELAIKQAL